MKTGLVKQKISLSLFPHLYANNQNYYDENDYNLQKKFKSLFPKNSKWMHGNMHGELRANYSINFLRKNLNWLN